MTEPAPTPSPSSVVFLFGGAFFDLMSRLNHTEIDFWMGLGLFICGYISYANRFLKWWTRRQEIIRNKKKGNNPKT